MFKWSNTLDIATWCAQGYSGTWQEFSDVFHQGNAIQIWRDTKYRKGTGDGNINNILNQLRNRVQDFVLYVYKPVYDDHSAARGHHVENVYTSNPDLQTNYYHNNLLKFPMETFILHLNVKKPGIFPSHKKVKDTTLLSFD